MTKNWIEPIETQLTVARWHLDAMARASADGKGKHLEQVTLLCEAVEQSMRNSEFPPVLRTEIDRRLAVLRARLNPPPPARKR